MIQYQVATIQYQPVPFQYQVVTCRYQLAMLSYQANNVPLQACNESKPDCNDPRMKSYVPEQNALKQFSKVITHGKLEIGDNEQVMIRKQVATKLCQVAMSQCQFVTSAYQLNTRRYTPAMSFGWFAMVWEKIASLFK